MKLPPAKCEDDSVPGTEDYELKEAKNGRGISDLA
jgi:hypothetical protein